MRHLCLWTAAIASACATSVQQSPTVAGRVAGRVAEKVERFREKYPYSVLGEDYGLLTEEDVATSSCVARASPFSLHELTAHPYWQCFSLKASAFECEEADTNEEGRTAILAIVLKKNGVIHDYLSRRAIPMNACRAHATDWVRLTGGQDYVCVSGEFINPRENDPDPTRRAWIFESYKTAKGCDSYFKGGCSLAYQIQHGCDLAEMTRPETKKKD